MIIWRGKGGLVFFSVILGCLLTNAVFLLLPINTDYKTGYILQGIIMTFFVAWINYLFTKKFISEKVRFFIDEESGERIQVKDGSHLFFIPNRYWTWIILILGIALTIATSPAFR